jgi:hypothetical protein
MDQITIRLDNSYGFGVDALIGELLGSEIVLHKDNSGSKANHYRYRCPLLIINISIYGEYFNAFIGILDNTVNSVHKQVDEAIRDSFSKINNFLIEIGYDTDEAINYNPLYQLLVSVLNCSLYDEPWKGFKYNLNCNTFTLKYNDEIILEERISVIHSNPIYYINIIKEILAEMRNGTSKLLQYSSKRMKSARK